MSQKIFNDKEIETLMQNKYVLKVTRHVINFSAEFKALAYCEMQNGRSLHAIFESAGIDPASLGEGRISALKGTILKEGIEGKGFYDIERCRDESAARERIKQLEQQLEYKNQEIEFLKKIVSLGGTENQR